MTAIKLNKLTDEQKKNVVEKYEMFKELSQSCPGICPENNPNKKVIS